MKSVCNEYFSLLKDFSTDEEMRKFPVIRILGRPFGALIGPMQNAQAVNTIPFCVFNCVVVTPEFCITQSIEPGMLTPKDCIPEHFKDCQQTHYSDCILLSEPTSAAKQLYFILEMLEPFWLQITKKTVNYWLLRTKFSAFLDTIQQHVHDPDIPSNR